ncbi:MAG: type II toxin-antitoxin system VapC family toxin [Acidimicrobiales bacterium]
MAETAWLLLDRFGAEAQQQFVSTIVRLSLAVIDPVVDDWARILELISTYADLNLDVVDASTVAVAERLGLVEVATMDERDFRVIRPAHVEAFELLPGPA